MIKAVLFDFDGTLSNRQDNAYHIFAHLLRKYFPDFDDIEFEAMMQDMMLYDANGTYDIQTRLIPFKNKYGSHLPDTFDEEFIPVYYNKMYEFCRLKKETIPVLEALKGKYKLAIMSNGTSKPQHDKIDKVGIAPYFDLVWVSGDHEYPKPRKEAFDEVLALLGVKADEALMVGDVFCNDMLGAHYAGMRSVWILEDSERPADFYKDYRIRKLDELLGILDELNGDAS